ncbi:9337_t:CDS:1, partial [Paraglomus occultum]
AILVGLGLAALWSLLSLFFIKSDIFLFLRRSSEVVREKGGGAVQ